MSAARPEPRRAARVAAAIALAAALATLAPAHARPPREVLEQQQQEEELALDYLVRRTDSLSRSLVDRRAHLRKRLRVIFKLSQGGYLRLLLGAVSPTDLFARRNAAERILRRDVHELEAVREELAELDGLRNRLRASGARSSALLTEAREAQHAGAAVERVRFRRPVPGRVVRRFGAYRDDDGLDATRDGCDLATHADAQVHGPAAGVVRGVVDLPGIGTAVVIDHGGGEASGGPGGWMSIIGGLGDVRVRTGERVPEDAVVGLAAGDTVHVQLSQNRTWVDPALFF